MPQITKSPAGTFCWLEHSCDDPTRVKRFYADIFGWNWIDQPPMSDGSPYSIAKLDSKNVCGATKQQSPAKKNGAPPSWVQYIAVDDVDATVAAAEQLNAKTLMGAEDVGPPGRMAVIADPTGGVIALWQVKESMGPWLYAENGALCWNELLTSNADIAGGFYTKLFGWHATQNAMGESTYTVFKQNGQMVAGMVSAPKSTPQPRTAWSVYLQVTQVDAAVTKALSVGATVVTAAADAPSMGRSATLKDPAGVAFGLFQAPPKR